MLKRPVKGDAPTLPVNQFVALSQRGIDYIRRETQAALDAEGLSTAIAQLDIDNPDDKMTNETSRRR